MKGFNCPNCGKRQPIKLDAPSRVALVCIECGKSLLVKMDKGKWSVAIEEDIGINSKTSVSSHA